MMSANDEVMITFEECLALMTFEELEEATKLLEQEKENRKLYSLPNRKIIQ